MPTPRVRADIALVEAGLVPSRERARAAILAGEVTVDGVKVTKAGEQVDPGARFEVAAGPRFVSRGGTKLAGALEAFGIDPAGLRAVDIGASTGGFTDCLLQGGAVSVTAVDVGYGQLAWSLRNDPRVTVLERTNIRNVEPSELGEPFDLAVVDVSFIGLDKVLPKVRRLLRREGSGLILVKPQFEAGKGNVGKRGVVRDPQVQEEVLERVGSTARELGFVVRGLTFSPITGPEGNIEFWMWLAFDGTSAETSPAAVVARAHETLGGSGAHPDRPQRR
jgi:23S rRNA (cytidine1920-2'-O)/16S rRNA (cytidine1409-2'-O)-methyltransferase